MPLQHTTKCWSCLLSVGNMDGYLLSLEYRIEKRCKQQFRIMLLVLSQVNSSYLKKCAIFVVIDNHISY